MSDFWKKRTKSRKLALKVLYQMEYSDEGAEEVLKFFEFHFSIPLYLRAYVEYLVKGVENYRKEIDSLLNQVSHHWKVIRMSRVDRNILRIGCFEMFFSGGEIPPKVAINEAIKIAKCYGNEGSSAFINGLLDALLIYHK